MATGGRIDYTVGFKVDNTQLNNLKTQLQQLSLNVNQLYMNNAGKGILDTQKINTDISSVQTSIGQLQTALTNAFNTQLGTLNITKFNQELKGLNLSKIQADMASLGAQGQNAFRSIAAAALSTNMQLKQSHTFLRSMADTMANTLKWGAASAVMRTFTNGVRKAYSYVKELDRSLNDIKIVTKQSAEEMDAFAIKANKAAKELKVSTTAYTNAALIYAQQGLKGQELETRTNVTMKVSNVTGVDAQEASEYLTAVWNGYKVSAEETEMYVDKLANVAAHTASNLEELSTGMSKVASAANIMGVDVDQLNAQLSTIISVTREAPETIGTSLKTVYARMADIQAGLDEETTLDTYTKGMAEMGINVLDAQNNLRDMGDVVEEIGNKWSGMTREQQVALAQTIAGQRQYSRMLALFDNWDKYNQALDYSKNATGELQAQQDIYTNSIQAHLSELKAETQELYSSLMDPDDLNPMIDSLKNVVSLFTNFVQVIGGGSGALQMLGIIGMKVFNDRIVNGLTTTITNMQTAKYNAEQLAAEMEVLAQYEKVANQSNDSRLGNIISMKREVLKYSKAITAEDREAASQIIKQTEELYKQQDVLTKKQEQGAFFLQRRTGENYDLKTEDGINKARADLPIIKQQIEEQVQARNLLVDAMKREQNAYNEILNSQKVTQTSLTKLDTAKKAVIKQTSTYILKLQEQIKNGLFEEKTAETLRETYTSLSNKIAIYKTQQKELATIKGQITRVTKANISEEEKEAQLKELNRRKQEIENNLKTQYTAIQTQTNLLRQQSGAAIQQESDALDREDKSLRTLFADLINVKNGLDNLKNGFKNFVHNLGIKDMVQSTLNGVRAVSQFTMGLNSLFNAIKAFGNKDLSPWERFSQLMMGLGMSAPMVLSAVKLFKDTIFTISAQEATMNAAKSLGLKIEQKETAELTRQELIRERMLQIIAKERALNKQPGSAYYSGTKNFERVKKQATKDVAKETPNNTSSNLKTMAVIALVIAAIMVLKKGIDLADKAYNKAKYAAEEAAKSAKVAAEEFDKARESYQNFQDTVSKYDSAVIGLENLTKGTAEYKEKVLEANEAALKLIQTVDGLNYTINAETGLIEINKESWDDVKEAQLRAMESAQSYAAFSTQRSREANLEYENTKFNREKVEGKDTIGHMTQRDKEGAIMQGTGAATGALLGAAGTVLSSTALGAKLGLSIGPWGAAIGAAIGLIVGGVSSIINAQAKKEETKEEKDSLKILAEAYKKDGNSVLTPQSIDTILSNSSEKLRDSLKNMDSEELEKQIQAIVANTEALELNSQVIAKSANYNSDNEYYNKLTSEEEQNLANKIIADKRSKATEEQIEEARKKAKDLFGGGFLGIGSDKDAYDEYLKYRYGDEAKNYRVENQWGSAGTLQKKNEDGTWENVGTKDGLSNDEVIDFLQEQYLLQMTGADEASLNKIMEAGKKIDAIQGVENEEVLAIQSSLASGDTADLSVLSPEQIAELESQMSEIGGLLGKDYAEALQKGIDSYDEASYYKHLKDQYEGALSAAAEDLDMDKDIIKMYTDNLLESNEELAKTPELAVKATKQNIEFAQGTEKLQQALEDNLDVLKNWEDGALETYEAAREVQVALEEMFGVKVSADFIKENLKDIEKAAEGDIQAIEKLELLAAKDYAASLSIDEDRLLEVNTLLDQLANTEVGIGVTTEVDTSEGIKALNELLASGVITQEEMENMFSSIGYTPEVKMVKVTGDPTTTVQTHTIDGPGPLGYTYTDTIESQTDITVPQIAEENMDTGDIKVGTVNSGSFTKTTSAQSRANAQGSLGDKDIKSDSQKNAENIEYLDEERDIYHDINVELERLENNLNKVQKAREKLVGKDLIDSYDKELKLLNKQIEANKTKLAIAKMEAKEARKSLKKQGVKFAKDGTVKNYNDILEQKEAEINGMISKYKSMTSADQQEQYNKKIEKKKEEYEDFKEYLDRYEEIINSEIPGIEDAISEGISQQIEINIEKFGKDIELSVDLNDFKKEWRELQKSILFGDDNPFENFAVAMENMEDIMSEDGSGLLQDQIDRANLYMDEYDKIINGGTSEIFKDSAEAALAAAKEMNEQAMTSAENVLNYIEQMEESINNAYDQILEVQDQILSTYDKAIEVLEHQMNVQKLLFGEDTDIQILQEEKLTNLIDKITTARTGWLEAQQRLIELESTGAKDTAEYAKAQIELNDRYQEIFSSVEDALGLINDIMRSKIQKALEKIETTLTKRTTWTEISKKWEDNQEIAELYLTTVNKIYEIEKLIQKVNDDLVSQQYQTLYAQQELNKFKEEELKLLQQKDKITKADLDRANKRYELKLAEIALEEARNNKSTMQLTRDSQGNYVYQYGTDDDKISEAQQNVEDLKNELYNQNAEVAKDYISKFNSAGQEMQDELNALYEDPRFQEYLGVQSRIKESENTINEADAILNNTDSTEEERANAKELKRQAEEQKKADLKRSGELEAWLNGSIDDITNRYSILLDNYSQEALANINYLFTDLGMDTVDDLNNLTAEQKQILSEQGINVSDIKSLAGFNVESVKAVGEELKLSTQTIVAEYAKQTNAITDAASLVAGAYTETLEQINTNINKIKTTLETLATDYNKNFKQEFIDGNKGSMKAKLENAREKLKDLVSKDETKSLYGNSKRISNALTTNKNEVKNKIQGAINAINNKKVDTGDTTTNKKLDKILNKLKKVVKDNNTKIDNTIVEGDGTTNIDPKTGSKTNVGKIVSRKGYESLGQSFVITSQDKDGNLTIKDLTTGTTTKNIKASDLNISKRSVAKDYVTNDGDGYRYMRNISTQKIEKVYAQNDKGKYLIFDGKEYKWIDENKYAIPFDINQRVSTENDLYKSGSWVVEEVGYEFAKLKDYMTNKTSWIDINKIIPYKNGPAQKTYWENIEDDFKNYVFHKTGDYSNWKPIAVDKQSKQIVAKDINNYYANKHFGEVGIMYYGNKDYASKYFKSTGKGASISHTKETLYNYSFDTGGYTGQWADGSREGRWALLHQKELVLNEQDTPKILDAVKLVREMSVGSIIADFQKQMQDTLSSLENDLIGAYTSIESMAAAGKKSTDQLLQQQVQIDATFPDVHDAREVEQALSNLVNVASQFAYEKK